MLRQDIFAWVKKRYGTEPDYLREKEGFHPAYHMNKDKWITARLDGIVPEDEIKSLIDLSFRLTGQKRREDDKNAKA